MQTTQPRKGLEEFQRAQLRHLLSLFFLSKSQGWALL